jgi:hypothetical protein
VTALALSAIAVSVYKAWPLLYPQTAERARLNPDCNLRKAPCSVRFQSGGSVVLDIQPRGIPVLRPLQIQVELDALPTPQRVELDFAGFDMDMGYNRVVLNAGSDTGSYSGSGMLPICVRDRMTWEARVLVYLPDGILAAPFRFETYRSP